LSAALLAVVMVINLFVARRLHLPRGDEIVLLFCGSKKSLVSACRWRRDLRAGAGRRDHPAADDLPPAPAVHLRVVAARYRRQVDGDA